jgi:hypothetical protein
MNACMYMYTHMYMSPLFLVGAGYPAWLVGRGFRFSFKKRINAPWSFSRSWPPTSGGRKTKADVGSPRGAPDRGMVKPSQKGGRAGGGGKGGLETFLFRSFT